MLGEVEFKQRAEYLRHCLLDEPILYRLYSQLACSPARLRDLHATHRRETEFPPKSCVSICCQFSRITSRCRSALRLDLPSARRSTDLHVHFLLFMFTVQRVRPTGRTNENTAASAAV